MKKGYIILIVATLTCLVTGILSPLPFWIVLALTGFIILPVWAMYEDGCL